MMTKENRTQVVTDYRRHEKDTGSPEVQVALLSKRIAELTEHFKIHNKDFAGLRGLQALVHKRRSLLTYVRRQSEERYKELVSRLNLRK